MSTLEGVPSASNENKMSDGGRDRVSLGVEVLKSSQKWSAQRSGVRSIAWLDGWGECSISELQRLADNVDQLIVEQKPKMAASTEMLLGEALQPR